MGMTDKKWAMTASTISAILTRQNEINELINNMVAFLTDEEKDNELETNKEVLGCIRCAALARALDAANGNDDSIKSESESVK
jgi:hypothetical protein